jgi:hypothetical protein
LTRLTVDYDERSIIVRPKASFAVTGSRRPLQLPDVIL